MHLAIERHKQSHGFQLPAVGGNRPARLMNSSVKYSMAWPRICTARPTRGIATRLGTWIAFVIEKEIRKTAKWLVQARLGAYPLHRKHAARRIILNLHNVAPLAPTSDAQGLLRGLRCGLQSLPPATATTFWHHASSDGSLRTS